MGILEAENIGRDKGVEHALRIDKKYVVETKKRKRDKETKKVKGTKDAEEVSMEKRRAIEDEVFGMYVGEGNGAADNAERKKKKKREKNKNKYEVNGDADNAERKKKKKREKNKNKFDASSHGEDFAEWKKKKARTSNTNEADLAKDVDGNVQSTTEDGNFMKNSVKEKAKKKKNENCKDDSFATKQDLFMLDSVDNDSNVVWITDTKGDIQIDNANKEKKKKTRAMENVSNDHTPKRSGKKVRFSDHIEGFPPPDDSNPKKGNNEEDNLVRGKRFTREEDEIVKEAVCKYILEHELGEQGLNMVLNCKQYPNVKRCWKEIAKAIPYRPYTATYYRAQVLFRRSENRKWTQEEYEMVLKYQEEHGNKWRELADELGKHRWHVKDTWRRIKLRNQEKGCWSQKEYQELFSLVNYDLQLKVSEEKRSKHGMLRDNICWTAISINCRLVLRQIVV